MPVRPEDRLRRLETKRDKIVRSVQKRKPKDSTIFLPGEENLRKTMAVTLRCASLSFADIADHLGVSETTVRNWFAEKEIATLYHTTLETLSTAALELLKTYTVEAIVVIAEVMRGENTKFRLDAAREILDRGGVPKISRSESKQERTETLKHTMDDQLIARMRELPPAKQEEFAVMLEQIESWLDSASGDAE